MERTQSLLVRLMGTLCLAAGGGLIAATVLLFRSMTRVSAADPLAIAVFVTTMLGLALPLILLGGHTLFVRDWNDAAINQKLVRAVEIVLIGFVSVHGYALIMKTIPVSLPVVGMALGVAVGCWIALKKAPSDQAAAQA